MFLTCNPTERLKTTFSKKRCQVESSPCYLSSLKRIRLMKHRVSFEVDYTNITNKQVWKLYLWAKFMTTTSYIWLLCMHTAIREKGCVSVISILNSNKELAAEIIRAINKKAKCGWCLYKVNGNKQRTPDVYRS